MREVDKSTTNFYEQVYAIVRLIPRGRVTSYGAIAKVLGRAGSARMVGYAMKSASLVQPALPAHRVVNSMGLLSGRHAFETDTYMQEMLENEGIAVENEKVVNFKDYFWNPNELADEL